MSNCVTRRHTANAAQTAKEMAYDNTIQTNLRNVIGNPNDINGYDLGNHSEKKVKEARRLHLDTYNKLYNKLWQIGVDSGFSISPNMELDKVSDYLQYKLGQPVAVQREGGEAPPLVTLTPQRMKSVNSAVTKLLKWQKGVSNKIIPGRKLPWFERAFTPSVIFGMKFDKLGVWYDYIKAATQLTERSHGTSAEYVKESETLNNKLRANIANVISSQLVTEDMVIEGLEVDIRESGILSRKKVDRVKFLGSFRNANGQVRHTIEDTDGNQTTVPESRISRDEIIRGLTEKYIRFTNDLLHGQTMDIKFVNLDDKVSKSDADKLKFVFQKARMKKTAGDSSPDMHTTIWRGVKYTWVSVKDDESGITGKEQYRAYIVKHEVENEKPVFYWFQKGKMIYRKKSTKDKKLANPRDIEILRDGFWKSRTEKYHGEKASKHINNRDETVPINGSIDESFSDFRYMENQPNEKIVIGETMGDTTVDLWSFIRGKRSLYRRIASKFIQMKAQEAEMYQEAMPLITEALQKRYKGSPEEMKEAMEKITNFIGANNSYWVSESRDFKGNIIDYGIHTPNSMFIPKQQNYAPRMYEDEVLADMLTDTIDRIKNRRLAKEMTDEEGAATDLMIESFEDMYKMVAYGERDLDYSLKNRIHFGARTSHLKHRMEWTDGTRRRKDSGVDKDYIQSTFYGLSKNNLMAKLMKTIGTMANVSSKKGTDDFFSTGHIDYLVERTKMTLNDPKVENPMGKWASSGGLAGTLNVLGLGGRNWTEQDAQDLIVTVRAVHTMALLGARGAASNRTQTINDVIKFGWSDTLQAYKWIKNEDSTLREQAEAIIRATGTDQLITAFADIMAPSDDINMGDAGIISFGIPFLIPTNVMVDFMKMKWYGRDGFLENGVKEVDDFLNSIETNRIERKNKRFWNMLRREETRVGKGFKERRKIEELRKLFVEIMEPAKGEDTEKDEEDLRKRFKKLMGDVSETRLKRMVAWKLQYMPPILGGLKEFFTYTEGERIMRAVTVIATLLAADRACLLGSSENMINYEWEDEKGMKHEAMISDRFRTPTAINMARMAVRNSMFGMSREHMGLAFSGFGHGLFQYKEYPLQQHLHDWQIVSSFLEGNKNGKVGWAESVGRLTQEAWKASMRTKNGQKYDISDPEHDPEAASMLRFLGTRMMATTTGVAIESMNLFFKISRVSPVAGFTMQTVRGGENPLIAMAGRALTYALVSMFAHGDNDDEESEFLLWSISRLVLPLWFTLPIFMGRRTYQIAEEVMD